MTAHLPARTPRTTRPTLGPVPIVAAAQQVTGRRIGHRSGVTGGEGWQADAWDALERVGELRYAAQHIGRSIGRAGLAAAHDPPGAAEPRLLDPDPDDFEGLSDFDLLAADLVASFGGGSAGQSTLLTRLGVLLFVPGEGYIVGMAEDPDDPQSPQTWLVASPSEISAGREGTVTLDMGDGKREMSTEDVIVTRVWNPHPRLWWEADSPTRSALPILRELIGLSQHVDASVESRLAGAGLLVIGNSTTFAGNPEDLEDGEDPFVEALLEAMVTPISDRDSAAAVVPMVVRVPDDSVDTIKHLTFATPFDASTQDLRAEAITRLGMALDIPPEVLTGVADASHWSAWAISENTIVAHVEPMLTQVADAMTVGFLRPAMIAAGVPEVIADEYSVWWSTDALAVRPNRSSDAQAAHAAGVISDDALRAALGFGAADAPAEVEGLDPAVKAVLDLVTQAPSLAQAPGMPALLEQVRALLAGGAPPSDAAAPEGDGPAGGIPDTQGDPGEPTLASALGLLP